MTLTRWVSVAPKLLKDQAFAVLFGFLLWGLTIRGSAPMGHVSPVDVAFIFRCELLGRDMPPFEFVNGSKVIIGPRAKLGLSQVFL